MRNADEFIKGVYCLTSPSGKRYVGIGMGRGGIKRRWKDYKWMVCKKQPKLYNALKKYGSENFKYEVILVTDDIDRAKRVEKQLIALWNLQSDKYGYNISAGGDLLFYGCKHTNETKEKMSKIKFGKKITEETRQKLRDRVITEETRQKMRDKKINIPLSKKHKENLSKKMTGMGNPRAKFRKIRNITTGEVVYGALKTMGNELGFNSSNILKNGKSKNWELINET